MQERLREEHQEAIDKLNCLKNNPDETERTKTHILKADLQYYAIPDLVSRIKTLKQDLQREARVEILKQYLQRDIRNSKHALDEKKQSQAPHRAVKTDSEESESS